MVTLLAVTLLWTAGRPAAACSCGRPPLEDMVDGAVGVYVGWARLPDPFPGVSFRVDRALKGPTRANVRADVDHPLSAGTCGVQISRENPYVLLTDRSGHVHIGGCSELVGEQEVAEVERLLGPGEPAPWRPPVGWLLSWVAVVALPGSVLATLVTPSRKRG